MKTQEILLPVYKEAMMTYCKKKLKELLKIIQLRALIYKWIGMQVMLLLEALAVNLKEQSKGITTYFG